MIDVAVSPLKLVVCVAAKRYGTRTDQVRSRDVDARAAVVGLLARGYTADCRRDPYVNPFDLVAVPFGVTTMTSTASAVAL